MLHTVPFLVHGAWHGAFVWQTSGSVGRARPHRHGTDLTGLGERRQPGGVVTFATAAPIWGGTSAIWSPISK